MEYSKIKKSLKKFGLNFNNKIVKAIEDIHKDTGGNITEITENNLEEVIAATDSIIMKLGLDGEKADLIDVTGGSNAEFLCLVYAKIKNNLIELPINYLNNFMENYKLINVYMPIYIPELIPEMFDGAPIGTPIINTTSNSVNVGGTIFNYSSTRVVLGDLFSVNEFYFSDSSTIPEGLSHMLLANVSGLEDRIKLFTLENCANGFRGVV